MLYTKYFYSNINYLFKICIIFTIDIILYFLAFFCRWFWKSCRFTTVQKGNRGVSAVAEGILKVMKCCVLVDVA